ncbi:MAG: polysaccharide biosynthesis tyrosine autokinase [Bacteroidales bacterium]|nr:polysaccharide biosynthesis tyrosine autokinase [Bacteroidales bacterium]
MAEEQNNNYVQGDAFSEESSSSFNPMLWVARFAHYWYLFVLAALIALAAAYVKNRKWLPSYLSETKVMVANNTGQRDYAFMQGFSAAGYNNNGDVLLMLKSYEMIRKTVQQMPKLQVDYYNMGRFRQRSLYQNPPIKINILSLNPATYGYSFKFEGKDEKSFVLTVMDGQDELYTLNGNYNTPIGNETFSFVVEPQQLVRDNKKLMFGFRFRSEDSLVGEFVGRVQAQLMSERSSVISITLESNDLYRDVDFLNMLDTTFLADNLEEKNREAVRTIEFIDDQLIYLGDSLNVTESGMRNYRVSHNILDINSYSQELISKSNALDQKRIELDNKDKYFRYLSDYLSHGTEDENALVAPSSLGVADPTLLSLVDQYNAVQTKRMDVGPKNPNYEVYTKQMAHIRQSLLEVLNNVKQVYRLERNSFNSEVSKLNFEMSQLPEKQQRMINYERQYKINDSYYTFLLQKRFESQIRKVSNTTDYRILQEARTLSITNGGKKSKVYLMYLIIGLLIPAAFVILKEYLSFTVKTSADVERACSFPVLGEVVHQQSGREVVAAIHYPNSVFLESLRTLRTRIEFILKRKAPMMIVITSAESGDGKTYFSANFAATYGLMNHNTILVDFDLRKPSQRGLLGFDDVKIGAVDYMIGDYSLDDVIIKNTQYGIDFLPVGTVPPDPAELIRSKVCTDMLEELKRRYSYVIVDTSPLGLVPDAYALMPISDINLLVVRSSKTSLSGFKAFTKQMMKDNVPNMHIVVNDVNQRKLSGYGYYSGSHNYYTDDKYEENRLTKLRNAIFKRVKSKK